MRRVPSLSSSCGLNAVNPPNDAWPFLAGAAALCLLVAAWLLVRGGRALRHRDAAADGMAAARPLRGARMPAALRLFTLAAFGAFTVSAALDGIAALLPPEVPVQAAGASDCAEREIAGGEASPCDALPDATPRK